MQGIDVNMQQLYQSKSMSKMLDKIMKDKIAERTMLAAKPKQIKTPLGLWKRLVEHGFFSSSWQFKHNQWHKVDKNIPWYPTNEQWQWFDWVLAQKGHFMFMGARKIGKTELLTIFQAVWLIYQNPKYKIIIIVGTDTRGKYLVNNIKEMLLALGVQFKSSEKRAAFTVANMEKTASISSRGVGSKLKGEHVNLIIVDDPLDESEGFSEVKRADIETRINEAKSMADRVMMIGQYVHEEDIFRMYEEQIPKLTAWQWQYPHLVRMTKELFCNGKSAKSLRSWGMNYEGVFYPNDETIFHNITLTSHRPNGRLYAVIDPAFGGKDRTAMAIGGLAYDRERKEDVLIVWLYSWKHHVSSVLLEIKRLILDHDVDYVYYEGRGNVFIADKLADYNIRSDPITTTTNKTVKIMTLKGYVVLGLVQIHVDTSHESLGLLKTWNPQSMHDDVPDSLAMLADKVFKFP